MSYFWHIQRRSKNDPMRTSTFLFSMEQVLDEEDEPDVQSRQAMRLKAEVRCQSGVHHHGCRGEYTHGGLGMVNIPALNMVIWGG